MKSDGERRFLSKFRKSAGEITISETRSVTDTDDYQKTIPLGHDSFEISENHRIGDHTWCMLIQTKNCIAIDTSLDKQGSKVTQAAKKKDVVTEQRARSKMKSILFSESYEEAFKNVAFTIYVS